MENGDGTRYKDFEPGKLKVPCPGYTGNLAGVYFLEPEVEVGGEHAFHLSASKSLEAAPSPATHAILT